MSWGSTRLQHPYQFNWPTYRLTYEDVDEMLDLGYRRNQKSARSPLGRNVANGGTPKGDQYPIAGGDD